MKNLLVTWTVVLLALVLNLTACGHADEKYEPCVASTVDACGTVHVVGTPITTRINGDQ